jgi:branched-subunit amino acid ABC-type transport system permease component
LTQQVLNAIFIGSIYALFAVGYTLVFGVLDVLNLAHSAVFMLGAVITYSLVALHGMPFLPAAVITILVCGLLGLLIEFVALRPLRRRNAPPISALISTIGLALIFVAIVEQATPGTFFGWLWQDGANSVRFPAGAVPDPTYHLAGYLSRLDAGARLCHALHPGWSSAAGRGGESPGGDPAGDQCRSDLRLDIVRVLRAWRTRRTALRAGDLGHQSLHRP